MKNLQTVLKRIDINLNKFQPKTMDDLINIVHSTTGAGDYGTHFSIVKYMGYLQSDLAKATYIPYTRIKTILNCSESTTIEEINSIKKVLGL